jgi:peroxin-4
VCRAIGLLLETPNPDSPLNCDAGNLLRSGDKLAYEQMVRLYATEYGVSV